VRHLRVSSDDVLQSAEFFSEVAPRDGVEPRSSVQVGQMSEHRRWYRPRTRRERSTSWLCRPAMTSASCRSSAARAPDSSARASASPPLCTAVCKLIRRSSSRCRAARGSSSPLIRPPHRLHLQGSAASARRSANHLIRRALAAPGRWRRYRRDATAPSCARSPSRCRS
jgi:hypothetical protein